MKFVIFYGSVRSDRQGIKLAKFLKNQIVERNHQVELIDPLVYDFGLLDKMYKEIKEEAPEKMKELAQIIKEADGFYIVSGEYNHSIPPALTNLMDHFLEAYFFRPSAIVTYSAGRFGGVRAAMQLRAFLAEIGTVSIPTLFPVPFIQKAFDEEGNPISENYKDFVKPILNEMDWYAKVMKEGKTKYKTPY